MNRISVRIALATAILYFGHFASSVSAVAIAPGSAQFPAVAEPDPVGATLVFSTGALPFASPTINGTLNSTVWRNDTSNPFGLNALTFTYELTAGVTSLHDIARLFVANYNSFLTDASFTPGLGVAPTVITRSADGEVMGFNFISPAIDGGQSTTRLTVQTNATDWRTTIASLINGTTASVTSV